MGPLAMRGTRSLAAPPPKRFGPSIKMKQLHWEKLPDAQVAKTIWGIHKVDEEYYKRELDFKEFENQFAAKLKVADSGMHDSCHNPRLPYLRSPRSFFPWVRTVADLEKMAKKKPDKISVLDSKRAYNCCTLSQDPLDWAP